MWTTADVLQGFGRRTTGALRWGVGPKNGGGGGVFTYTLYGKTEGTWLVWWREMWLGYGGISHILITYRILYVPDLLAIIFLPWTVSFSVYIERLEAVLLRLRGTGGFLTRISFKMFSFIIAPLRKAVFTDNQPSYDHLEQRIIEDRYSDDHPNAVQQSWDVLTDRKTQHLSLNKDLV